MDRPVEAHPEHGDNDQAEIAETAEVPDDEIAKATDTGFVDAMPTPTGKDPDGLADEPVEVSDHTVEDTAGDRLGHIDDDQRAIRLHDAAASQLVAAAVAGGDQMGGDQHPEDRDTSGNDPHGRPPEDIPDWSGQHAITARTLGLIGISHSEVEAARLAAARAESIALVRIAARNVVRKHGNKGEQLQPAEQNAVDAARFLNNTSAEPRVVVGLENERVEHLMHEPSTEEREPGRTVIGKLGKRWAEERQHAADRHWQTTQGKLQEGVQARLVLTRDTIRARIVGRPEDAAIDEHIGLRTEGGSLLPEYFKHLHHLDEEQTGHPISFMEWMSDYASDEQLTNVWQWHDHYLQTRDTSAEYQEQITRVNSGFASGLYESVQAGELHPSMLDMLQTHRATIRHDSPFSPCIAHAYAYVEEDKHEILTQAGIQDYWLYHEKAHLFGGLGGRVGEPVTDLIANTVFNHAHIDDPDRDLRASDYWDGIVTVASLSRMTEGGVGLHELSEFYIATDNERVNGVALDQHTNNEIGLLVGDAIFEVGARIMQDRLKVTDSGTARREMFAAMRAEVAFYEAMLLDEDGRRISESLIDLQERMVNPATIDRFGMDQVARGLMTIIRTKQCQQDLHDYNGN